MNIGNRKPAALIHARVTLEGPAEELLVDVQSLRGGKRSVHLSVEVSRRHYWAPDHHIPEIKGGQIQAALEKLEMMSKQTIVDEETDQRLERLIKDFGQFTK
jgi:hypothetical protein